MEKGQELKARLYVELENRGYLVRINYRYRLNKPVQGFKVVVLDLAILDKNKPIFAFYVGPEKKRRIFKYKLSKIPYLKLIYKEDLYEVLPKFQRWVIERNWGE